MRTMTLCLDMVTAPRARVEVMITGSISGVSPTAMLMAKRSAPDQSLLKIPLIKNTTGTITSIIRTSSLLTASTPRSKLLLARSPLNN